MSTAGKPPLLLVLAHGIGANEFAALDPAALGLAAGVPFDVPADPERTLRERCDATDQLRDLGVAVDRRGLLLRPAGCSDEACLANATRRATGPATVTILASTSVLDAAAVGGPRAAEVAARQLGDTLANARERLRRGDPPETWCFGLGSAVPVTTTFDLLAAWRRHVVPPLAQRLRVHAGTASATVVAADQRALDLAAATLTRPPFARFGSPVQLGAARLAFRAHDGVAFGNERVACRAANTAQTGGVFAATGSSRAHRAGAPFHELLARFWMRAAELHAPSLDAAATAATPTATRPIAATRALAPTPR